MDLRVRGGTIITMDDERSIIDADVYVDAGRIAVIGGPPRRTRRTVDATGMVVIPGLINLHDHLRDLTPGIRIGEGLKIDALLRAYWRLTEVMGPEEYRVGAMLGAARLVKAGVTSVVDHVYPFHVPGLAESTIAGYEATGIRWFMARGIMTQPYKPICETATNAFRGIEELADVIPRERLFVAPVSLRQVPPSLYTRARRFADRHGLRLYTHIAETPEEVRQTKHEHGARPVELLHKLGFAGEDTIMVHCVQLSAGEMRQLAASGSHVVHCPTNHMKLAKGVTAVPKLLARGINVGLGVDTMGDVIGEMRQEVLLQSLANKDPGAISPMTALEMATRNGAAALGLGTELGSIEEGKRADLVCVDLRTVHLQPVLDPVWTLVNRAYGHDVAHVVVDGRVVVRDGKLADVDERSLVEEVAAVTSSYLKRTGTS
ncbi:MAG: amidohydrolase family protein [Acidimicrobiia bacterium]|nr:amidohydrolase family protein [Acidimicrobiia bacterium]